MTLLVVDASAVIAALTDDGTTGRWVSENLYEPDLIAPALLPFEAANVLGRLALLNTISPAEAALAHTDLLALPVELWPYEILAERIWKLRNNVSAYDASYVALAQLHDAPLITLDTRLANAAGAACRILTPPTTTLTPTTTPT